MSKKEFKIQESISGRKKSKIKRYQELVIGSTKLAMLLKYEIIVLISAWIPGALGVFLRSKLYPMIIGEIGKDVIFGSNIVVRHPGKIYIGDNVVIDDNVLLDAKGVSNKGITIENEVFIGRNSIISCKDGNITLKERANIGFNCEIFSSSNVVIGRDNLLAAYTYIVGGGNYKLDRKDIPLNQQPDFEGKGGIELAEDIWIGAHCVILDGVKIGKGSVVAAGAVVLKDIPSMSIAAGIPAKPIKKRN